MVGKGPVMALPPAGGQIGGRRNEMTGSGNVQARRERNRHTRKPARARGSIAKDREGGNPGGAGKAKATARLSAAERIEKIHHQDSQTTLRGHRGNSGPTNGSQNGESRSERERSKTIASPRAPSGWYCAKSRETRNSFKCLFPKRA